MKKQPKYIWLNNEGIAFCDIYYKNIIITGTAECHPDDQDVKSKLTGETIAEHRAMIKYLKFVKEFELRPQLKSLYQLYYSMKHSAKYNKKSYEAKMLYRQINHLENDLKAIDEEIIDTQKNLKEYLEKKEKDHEKIREVISKRELAENN